MARRTSVKSRSSPTSVIGVHSSRRPRSWSRDRAIDTPSNSVAGGRAGHAELARAIEPLTTASSFIRLIQAAARSRGRSQTSESARSTNLLVRPASAVTRASLMHCANNASVCAVSRNASARLAAPIADLSRPAARQALARSSYALGRLGLSAITCSKWGMASLALFCPISAAPSLLCISARLENVSVDVELALEASEGRVPRRLKARRCLRFMALIEGCARLETIALWQYRHLRRPPTKTAI